MLLRRLSASDRFSVEKKRKVVASATDFFFRLSKPYIFGRVHTPGFVHQLVVRM